MNMPHFLYYASNCSDYPLYHLVVPVFQLTAVVILDFIQPQRMAIPVAHLFCYLPSMTIGVQVSRNLSANT
jgi:hypothetical protein